MVSCFFFGAVFILHQIFIEPAMGLYSTLHQRMAERKGVTYAYSAIFVVHLCNLSSHFSSVIQDGVADRLSIRSAQTPHNIYMPQQPHLRAAECFTSTHSIKKSGKGLLPLSIDPTMRGTGYECIARPYSLIVDFYMAGSGVTGS